MRVSRRRPCPARRAVTLHSVAFSFPGGAPRRPPRRGSLSRTEIPGWRAPVRPNVQEESKMNTAPLLLPRLRGRWQAAQPADGGGTPDPWHQPPPPREARHLPRMRGRSALICLRHPPGTRGWVGWVEQSDTHQSRPSSHIQSLDKDQTHPERSQRRTRRRTENSASPRPCFDFAQHERDWQRGSRRGFGFWTSFHSNRRTRFIAGWRQPASHPRRRSGQGFALFAGRSSNRSLSGSAPWSRSCWWVHGRSP